MFFLALALHLTVHFTCLNTRLEDWSVWKVREPRNAHYIIGVAYGFVDIGYRMGGESNFFVRRGDGVKVSVWFLFFFLADILHDWYT